MGHSLQIWAYVIISIAFALGTSSLLLRLYCRWRLKTFGHDDAAAAFLIVCLPRSLAAGQLLTALLGRQCGSTSHSLHLFV